MIVDLEVATLNIEIAKKKRKKRLCLKQALPKYLGNEILWAKFILSSNGKVVQM